MHQLCTNLVKFIPGLIHVALMYIPQSHPGPPTTLRWSVEGFWSPKANNAELYPITVAAAGHLADTYPPGANDPVALT
uniref:Uncharacterized protein n=1 Tax=Panagrellus redivivus TaxID=6233 RepID=A0A7E4ZZS0_PANRE